MFTSMSLCMSSCLYMHACMRGCSYCLLHLHIKSVYACMYVKCTYDMHCLYISLCMCVCNKCKKTVIAYVCTCIAQQHE